MFTLNNNFSQYADTLVMVVGCGGTGGFVAEGLCRLLPAQGVILLLVDHDRVEETNLVRQNFTYENLGMLKSEALAKRLSAKFRRPVAYSTMPVGFFKTTMPGFTIGCVDNGPARRAIAGAHSVGFGNWWIDAGNGENYGQILIGNCHQKEGLQAGFHLKTGRCYALPLPSFQRPELLLQQPPQRSCAAAVAAQEQGPVINQVMAALVLEVVQKLRAGTLSWMQLYIDLEAGSLSTVQATPEAVSRITGIKEHKLVKGGEDDH